MFDDFSGEQSVAYRILKNGVLNNKCSHAYLINTNGYHRGFDFAKAFAKMLLCPLNKTNFDNCVNCTQCHLIDNNSFPELKIIESDGLWIKREQMDDLQEDFSMKSISSNKKVYIINGAQNLNVSASNSILKFLEEPEDGIVAILVTDNIYNVLGTIVSRCQVINLNAVFVDSDNMLLNIANRLYNDSAKIDSFVGDVESIDKIKRIIDFVVYMDSNHLDTLLYINDLWNSYISKDDYVFAFDIMIMFYNDVINYKLGNNLLLSDFESYIKSFASYDFSFIMKRVDLLIDLRNDLYYNVNLNLLMDKLVIRMEEIRCQ